MKNNIGKLTKKTQGWYVNGQNRELPTPIE